MSQGKRVVIAARDHKEVDGWRVVLVAAGFEVAISTDAQDFLAYITSGKVAAVVIYGGQLRESIPVPAKFSGLGGLLAIQVWFMAFEEQKFVPVLFIDTKAGLEFRTTAPGWLVIPESEATTERVAAAVQKLVQAKFSS